jgi:hypothetical protein
MRLLLVKTSVPGRNIFFFSLIDDFLTSTLALHPPSFYGSRALEAQALHQHPHAISVALATSWPVASTFAATAVSGDLTALALAE